MENSDRLSKIIDQLNAGWSSVLIRIRHIATGIFLMNFLLETASIAQKVPRENSEFLFKSCKQSVAEMDGPNNAANDEGSFYCLGYFEGFSDVVTLAKTGGLCLENARIGTLIRVYVAYMEKNPKHLDDLKIVGIVEALNESYACPKLP